MAKNNSNLWTAIIVALIVIATFGVATNFSFSTVGQADRAPEDISGEYSYEDRNVPVKFSIADLYDSANTVNATVKIYEEQPANFEEARAEFDDSENYNTASGDSENWDEFTYEDTPGTYYAVIEAPGYNREFVTFEVPSSGSEPLGEYSNNPALVTGDVIKMTQIGTVASAPSNVDLTLVNDTQGDEFDERVTLQVAEDTEMKGWKIVVTDEIGFSYDSNGNGVYDEGISVFEFDFAGETYEVFNANDNVNEFDSRDSFEASIDGVTASDEERLDLDFQIEAVETGDYSGADDEVLGEGDGTLSQVTVFSHDYDGSSNQFAQFTIVA